ncbi:MULTISPECIES: pilus assembly protein TadG-related protein [unclassified Microbacterium]|uniref:pilus assembly protein TadG-related protein n=1 Tax=unclassified Microbacterium TaxID=2609290 RepID=UPI00301671CF
MRRPPRVGPPARGSDDEGSVLLLALGYALLALALVAVCVDATSLYLTQKRAAAAADAAALAGADALTLVVDDDDGSGARAVLTDADVRAHASQVLEALGTAQLVDAATPDGVSARVRVAAEWHPPVLTVFVPDGWIVEATATSRTVLR